MHEAVRKPVEIQRNKIHSPCLEHGRFKPDTDFFKFYTDQPKVATDTCPFLIGLPFGCTGHQINWFE
jgi:hypothetical protein